MLYVEGNERLTLRLRSQWEMDVSAAEKAVEFEERAQGKILGELKVRQEQQTDGALNQLSQMDANGSSADQSDANGIREAHDPRDSKTLTEDLMRQLDRLGHHRGALMLSTSPIAPGLSETSTLAPISRQSQRLDYLLSAVTSQVAQHAPKGSRMCS